MAHHQDKRHEHPLMAVVVSFFSRRPLEEVPKVEDEESSLDVDEPPDNPISFRRRTIDSVHKNPPPDSYFKLPPTPLSPRNCKESLLTQALTTGPAPTSSSAGVSHPVSRAHSTASTYSNASLASTAELTSDGGLTSPARTSTPSPPIPSRRHTGLGSTISQGFLSIYDAAKPNQTAFVASDDHTIPLKLADPPDVNPGRKRCIRFACGGAAPRQTVQVTAKPQGKQVELSDLPKRACTLRFACPAPPVENNKSKQSERDNSIPSSAYQDSQTVPLTSARKHQNTQCTATTSLGDKTQKTIQQESAITSQEIPKAVPKPSKFKDTGIEDDAWIHETPRARPKLTVSDTLRKENAIRRLGEEAEQEALEEEKAEDEAELDEELEDLEDEEDLDSDAAGSDGGNETDDEEGFADSDDENEANPDYQFWTPAVTTAATSNDHLEHIRPKARRSTSESSIESAIHRDTFDLDRIEPSKKLRIERRSRGYPKVRPSTPELPDSTDFVCGTLDEDRPIEAAYKSFVEQRKLEKRGIIPQDLDPSFPVSDPDNDEEDEDGDAVGSEENLWITGRPDDSDDGRKRGRRDSNLKKGRRSPAISPKRMRSPPPPKRHKSPPPLKRHNTNRSPPPGRLFGHSPRRIRSPHPHLRNLKSPPSSRRPSISWSPNQERTGIDMPLLAQRPNLTHTKSLPRTPNPFWKEHRRAHAGALRNVDAETSADTDLHSRGPIAIIQGLETKRQRRKEKEWRMHCRNGIKDKERRCQPGKGAQRMRELGLEMADRNKAYGQRAQLVLSV
ncbi:hypothetical protein MMC19_003303 [Ptychographa xylographoides]|nr:hypothetical protein [Ptychographa xylographoides]